MEYVVLFSNIFLYFMEIHVNTSMCKYVYKNVLSCKNVHTYAAVLIYTIIYAFIKIR